MEQYLRELYCSRIIAGYVRYKEFRIQWPDKHTMYEACELYAETYESLRDQGLLTNKQLHEHLTVSGLWEPGYDFEIKKLTEEIDNTKVEIYNTVRVGGKPNKSKLEGIKGRINKLLSEKHKYDHLSCEGVAALTKWSWILENSVYTREGQRADTNILSLLEFWNTSRLEDSQLRELSRTEPWQTYWQSKTTQLFSMPDCELNDEQRRLIFWSKLYDNVRDSMEAPSESVMEDDDALDGWMVLQKRNRDKDKREKQIESSIKSDKIRNSQDVMVKAWTQKEADEITSINNEQTNMLRKMRLGQVNKSGSVEAKDLGDVRARKLMK